MKKNIVILENIRSCYNVGNIIRTADALGWNVALSGYTPSPFTQPKVAKTSLGAENNITILEFLTTQAAIEYVKNAGYDLVAAEVTDDAVELGMYIQDKNTAVIFGNEVAGVEKETLKMCDTVVKIPMQGEKESLNVGQTAAIFMWALRD